jgi:DNA polymerase I-like protein with 3'-5' exonuclease and polymerase domains
MNTDLLAEVVDAQKELVKHRRRRNAAIKRALSDGFTAYGLAKHLRISLGEDGALSSEGIRQIGRRRNGAE